LQKLREKEQNGLPKGLINKKKLNQVFTVRLNTFQRPLKYFAAGAEIVFSGR
jgi:hypothetical protein